MNRPQQGQRIVRLVRTLTGLGLLMVVITVGLIGWTLSRVRAERARATAEQEQLNRVSNELRQRAADGRAEIQAVLDETQPSTNRPPAVSSLIQFIADQPDPTRPDVRLEAHQFAGLNPRLAGAARLAQEWRANYDPVWQDVRQQRTLGQVRALITQLRDAGETLEGRRRLTEALEHKRWRNAKDGESARLARTLLNNQGREQSQGLNDFKSELAECARLVELLGGEEQLDNLADLKDNKLKPVLDRLGRTISAFGSEQTNAAALRPQAIEQLRTAISGAGPDGGGLFALRHAALLLRREREKMALEITALFQDIETANAGFALSAQARTAALTRQMEGGLASGWQRLLYVGGGCSALFLWLAWLISRGIGGQVEAIDHARAEAESGRQTTQKLMREQQAAAAELAAAHKEMKASEHRLRVILETQPECVKQVAADGTLLSMNRAGLCLIEADHIDQAIGRCVYDLVAPEHQAMFRALNDAVFRGESQAAEFEIIGLKGTRRWMRTHACPLRDLDGKIVAHLAVTSDITERKRAEAQLERAHKELIDVSRQAGMAEIATGVLHNVGNVLNSVNVSANLVSDQVRKAPVADLGRVVALLREQGANLGAFFTSDARGPKVPDFLAQLADKFTRQQESQLAEVAALQKNIEHIKDIVAMQQSYARVSGLTENLSPVELIEDALRMNSGSFEKHEVELVRELPADLPLVSVDKHKVLQILVNLLRNAKHACDDAGRADKRITVRAAHEHDRVRITITDNGVGIPPENLNRIFNHGFTTKKTGHGFGLHSAVNAAKEMGGGLTVHSDGPGLGAKFTLELPVEAQRGLGAPPPAWPTTAPA